ncbi:MAG TPA: amidohydrolase [Candidatus Sulfotelmatobacter sp.]|nr:amidohydrolase [Candidatus Sulfotelmatobacter sp.]
MNRHRHTRRDFLGLAGWGMAGVAGSSFLNSSMLAHGETAEADPRHADLVVFNAKIYTVDPQIPQAQAFAVKGGKFAFVGSTTEAKAFIGQRTRTFDAKQMTIVPGFIDCHNHAPGNTLLYEVLVGNPYEVEFVTIASVIEKLRAQAQKTPAGFWVEGHFFDDTKVKDNRQLNLHDLDQVSKEHPVCVHHRGGHTSFYNSKALQLAGVNKQTPNRMGGTYDRDEHGELTGRVTDRARDVFDNVGKRETFTAEQMEQRDRDGLAYISKQFVRYGLTSVHHEEGDLFALQQVRTRGELLHRVSFEASGELLESMIKNGINTGFGDEWIRFGATSEHTADGSFSERTMALSQPYAGTNPPYSGNITENQEDLNAWAERVQRAGIQPNCHANGDVAIDMVLTAYERAQKTAPRPDVRPKITHCTQINDELLRRMKALDAMPAVFTTYAYYNSDKFHFYGEERMKHSMAYRSFIDAGIRPAAGSDFYPGPFAALMGIQGMVTRTGWNGETWGANQRISVDEALQVNTINGAYNSHEEGIKGSITPGKLADFVVLADDPHTVDKDKIKDIEIVETVTGGSTVFKK